MARERARPDQVNPERAYAQEGHSAVNAGAAGARVVINILLPKGAEATIFAKPR